MIKIKKKNIVVNMDTALVVNVTIFSGRKPNYGRFFCSESGRIIMARFFPLNVQILAVCSGENMAAQLCPDSGQMFCPEYGRMLIARFCKEKLTFSVRKKRCRNIWPYSNQNHGKIGHPNRPKYGHSFVTFTYGSFSCQISSRQT